MWLFRASFKLRGALRLLIGPAAPRCEPRHRDETDDEFEYPKGGALDLHASAEGKAVVTSNEFRCVYKEAHRASSGKIPLASSSRVGRLCRWQPLDHSWPWVAGSCAAVNVSGPKIIQCMQNRARAGARQSWSDWIVTWRLATVRRFEAQGRWKEGLSGTCYSSARG